MPALSAGPFRRPAGHPPTASGQRPSTARSMNLNTVHGSGRKGSRTATPSANTAHTPPPGATQTPFSDAKKWIRRLGLQITDTLVHGGMHQRAVADLLSWGLPQNQAEAIAAAPDYARAHAHLFGGDPPRVQVQPSPQEGLVFVVNPSTQKDIDGGCFLDSGYSERPVLQGAAQSRGADAPAKAGPTGPGQPAPEEGLSAASPCGAD